MWRGSERWRQPCSTFQAPSSPDLYAFRHFCDSPLSSYGSTFSRFDPNQLLKVASRCRSDSTSSERYDLKNLQRVFRFRRSRSRLKCCLTVLRSVDRYILSQRFGLLWRFIQRNKRATNIMIRDARSGQPDSLINLYQQDKITDPSLLFLLT